MLNSTSVWLSQELYTPLVDELAVQTMSDSLHSEQSETTALAIESSRFSDVPLDMLPFDVKDSIANDYYETGMSSLAQRYIEKRYIDGHEYAALQKIFNDIYGYAVRNDKHMLAYNIMVVLSQIPYQYLGDWACILAMAATRNKYRDVIELGIRCFENWESRDACLFLKQCSFSEKWLQEYADEVYAFIMEDTQISNVLFEKDHSWQVARRGDDSTIDISRYRSGYSSSGV